MRRAVRGDRRGARLAAIVEIDAAPVELNHEPAAPVGAGPRIRGRGLEPGGKFHGTNYGSRNLALPVAGPSGRYRYLATAPRSAVAPAE